MSTCAMNKHRRPCHFQGKWLRMKHQQIDRESVGEVGMIAKHAWESYHSTKWEETLVIDQARCPKELLPKGIYTQLTLAGECFNRDAELDAGWPPTGIDL